MSARQPRFEVVRGDDGWFARFIAANGREVWRTSETYHRRGAVHRAIGLATGHPVVAWRDTWEVPSALVDNGLLEVRHLDERAGSEPTA